MTVMVQQVWQAWFPCTWITTLLSSGSVAGITGHEAAPAFGKIVNQFVGIVSGLIGANCYNKYKSVKLPDALAFFSGKRAVAIFTALYSIVAALVLFFVWPLVYGALVTLGETFIGRALWVQVSTHSSTVC